MKFSALLLVMFAVSSTMAYSPRFKSLEELPGLFDDPLHSGSTYKKDFAHHDPSTGQFAKLKYHIEHTGETFLQIKHNVRSVYCAKNNTDVVVVYATEKEANEVFAEAKKAHVVTGMHPVRCLSGALLLRISHTSMHSPLSVRFVGKPIAFFELFKKMEVEFDTNMLNHDEGKGIEMVEPSRHRMHAQDNVGGQGDETDVVSDEESADLKPEYLTDPALFYRRKFEERSDAFSDFKRRQFREAIKNLGLNNTQQIVTERDTTTGGTKTTQHKRAMETLDVAGYSVLDGPWAKFEVEVGKDWTFDLSPRYSSFLTALKKYIATLVSFELTSKFRLLPRFTFKVDYDDWTLYEAKMKFEFDYHFVMSTKTVFGGAIAASAATKLAEVKGLTGPVFPIGPITLAICPGIDIQFALAVSVTKQFTLTSRTEATGYMVQGFQYTSTGGMTRINSYGSPLKVPENYDPIYYSCWVGGGMTFTMPKDTFSATKSYTTNSVSTCADYCAKDASCKYFRINVNRCELSPSCTETTVRSPNYRLVYKKIADVAQEAVGDVQLSLTSSFVFGMSLAVTLGLCEGGVGLGGPYITLSVGTFTNMVIGPVAAPAAPPAPGATTVSSADSGCSNIQGTCMEMSLCTGTTQSGLCGGAASRKCCVVDGIVPIADSGCASQSGTCKEQSLCTGTVRSGLCGGGATRKCCIPQGTAVAPTPPAAPITGTRQVTITTGLQLEVALGVSLGITVGVWGITWTLWSVDLAKVVLFSLALNIGKLTYQVDKNGYTDSKTVKRYFFESGQWLKTDGVFGAAHHMQQLDAGITSVASKSSWVGTCDCDVFVYDMSLQHAGNENLMLNIDVRHGSKTCSLQGLYGKSVELGDGVMRLTNMGDATFDRDTCWIQDLPKSILVAPSDNDGRWVYMNTSHCADVHLRASENVAVLRQGESLLLHQTMSSSESHFIMQADGNLVLTSYKTDETLWSSSTPYPASSPSGALLQPSLRLTSDGRLILSHRYAGSEFPISERILNPSVTTGRYLVAVGCDVRLYTNAPFTESVWNLTSRDSCTNLKLHSTNPLWHRGGSVLSQGEVMNTNTGLFNDNGVFEHDFGAARLVRWDEIHKPMWSTIKSESWVKNHTVALTLLWDGNLALFDNEGNMTWASNTAGSGATVLRLERCGLALYKRSPNIGKVWGIDGDASCPAVPDAPQLPAVPLSSKPHPYPLMELGHFLLPGQSLFSPNAQLIHLPDGNVVLYSTKDMTPLWATNTSGSCTTAFALSHSGHLDLHACPGTSPTPFAWSAPRPSVRPKMVVMGSDCSLTMFGRVNQGDYIPGSEVHTLVPPMCENNDTTTTTTPRRPTASYLPEGQSLDRGHAIMTPRFVLLHQPDGDVVFFSTKPKTQILWRTNTKGNCTVSFSAFEGNLILRACNGEPLWSAIPESQVSSDSTMNFGSNLTVSAEEGTFHLQNAVGAIVWSSRQFQAPLERDEEEDVVALPGSSKSTSGSPASVRTIALGVCVGIAVVAGVVFATVRFRNSRKADSKASQQEMMTPTAKEEVWQAAQGETSA